MPQVKCRQRRHAAVLTFATPPFRNGVAKEALTCFAQARRRHAVLDLKGVTPDPSLLKPIFALRRQTAKQEGRLVLCGLSDEIRDWLNGTLLLDLFEVQPDVQRAIASLAE